MVGGLVTVLTAVVTAVVRVSRAMGRTWHRVDQFMDDWYGEAERPGVAARAGMVERVGGMEDRLGRVEHEMHPNGGTSLRDAVDEANRRLATLCLDRDTPSRRNSAGG